MLMEGGLFAVLFSSVMGLIVSIVGYLIKRAVQQSDTRSQERQDEMYRQVATLHVTLKEIQAEVKEANHRMTKLEAWQIYARGQSNPTSETR